MGIKKKFDKIEKNETYYAAYGEEEQDEQQEQKTEKKEKPKKEKKAKNTPIDAEAHNAPQKERATEKYTFSREKRKVVVHKKKEPAEIEAAPKPPFVFALAVLCIVLIASFVVSSDLFSSLSAKKASYIKILLYVCAYIVPSVIYLLMPQSGRHLHSMRRFSASVMPFAASCLGLVFFVTALQKYIIAYVFSYSEAAAAVPGHLWLSILSGALLPAVCEELFVRGIFQHEVSEYAGGFCGIMAGALVFALLHFELQYFMIYMVAGIILGVVTHVSRSVFPAMLVHFLNNTISILLSDKLSFVATERIGGTLLIIVLASFCFGFLILTLHLAEKISEKRAERCLSHNDGEAEKEEKAVFFLCLPQGNTMKKSFKALTSPPMLIAYAVFVIAVFIGV